MRIAHDIPFHPETSFARLSDSAGTSPCELQYAIMHDIKCHTGYSPRLPPENSVNAGSYRRTIRQNEPWHLQYAMICDMECHTCRILTVSRFRAGKRRSFLSAGRPLNAGNRKLILPTINHFAARMSFFGTMGGMSFPGMARNAFSRRFRHGCAGRREDDRMKGFPALIVCFFR